MWEKADLFLFNPVLVKSKIAAFQSETAQDPPERLVILPSKLQSFQQTPTTKTHRSHTAYLKTRLNGQWNRTDTMLDAAVRRNTNPANQVA